MPDSTSNVNLPSHRDPDPFTTTPWIAQSSPSRWSKTAVLYGDKQKAHKLRSFDIHIPRVDDDSSSLHPQVTNPPQPDELPLLNTHQGPWLVYIHGGAWRDPNRSSADIAHSVSGLFSPPPPSPRNLNSPPPSTSNPNSMTAEPKLRPRGIISLNYSLSPHPRFPTPPTCKSRSARHPTHLNDTLDALELLVEQLFATSTRPPAAADDYILIGHSCGATLALQALFAPFGVIPPFHSGSPRLPLRRPRAIVGLNGLYDLPGLVHAPGEKHDWLRDTYAEFTRGAFGEDEAVWADVSPGVFVRRAAERDDAGASEAEKGAAREEEEVDVTIAWSQDDTLVPAAQGEDMVATLQHYRDRSAAPRSRLPAVQVHSMRTRGDHNDVWAKGSQKGGLAEVVREVLGRIA